jgi:hypothetical protein
MSELTRLRNENRDLKERLKRCVDQKGECENKRELLVGRLVDKAVGESKSAVVEPKPTVIVEPKPTVTVEPKQPVQEPEPQPTQPQS